MSPYSVAEVWTRFYEKLLFLLLHLTRLTTLLLETNRKGSWDKTRIRYKRCASPWTVWLWTTETGK